MTTTKTGADDVTNATVRLANGVVMPIVGLGVYQAARGDETRRAVRDALELGYRHVDTARIYGNESDVGAAIEESGVARADIFVTTKLWNDDHGFDSTLRAFDASAARLGLDVVDLYLVHWPVARKRLDTWKAFERLYDEKRVRAIGVSNFMVHHLDELERQARVMPMVNQIELSPFLQQRGVVERCQRAHIVVEAYSPLTRGARLAHPVVVEAARALGRTPAQVLLRFWVEQDVVVLPKSVTRDRIAENAAVFDFTLGPHRAKLDALEEGLVTGWDPRAAP